MRVLYGIERVPRTLAPDDPRLPAVELGPVPLRLNSVPLPAVAWGADPGSHAGRRAALEAWLLAQCGDYNATLRRAVLCLLDAMEDGMDEAAIAADLARFDGLYLPEDRFWSAPRPLPRAWWQQGGEWRHAELAIWDGAVLHALDIRREAALPAICREFWRETSLPMSPFRRDLVGGR
jgi:hypothetical protein